jgi:hypothetical protein
MTVPTYDQFIEPLLRFMAMHPEGVPAPRRRASDAYCSPSNDGPALLLTSSSFLTATAKHKIVAE